MNFLDEVKVVGTFSDAAAFGPDDLKFLELSGRQAFYSQGIFGQNTIGAVIDSGVSPHPDFGDRILQGKNFCKYQSSTNTNDDNKHGTHCAGSVAGAITGIAPQAKILPIKVLDAVGGTDRPMDIADGIKYAREWRGPKGERVDAISMSLSGTKATFGERVLEAIEEEARKCKEEGILIFASSGNTAKEEKRFPSGFDDVMAVGAVDHKKRAAVFSTTGKHVDICQVGVGVISTYNRGGYLALDGTSMSTPLSMGVGLLIACQHKMTFGTRFTHATNFYDMVKMNAKDLGIPGADKIYGVGFASVQPLNLSIELENGSRIIKFNGTPVTADIASRIESGRFLFELRSVAEYMGAYISSEAENEYHKTRANIIF